MGWLIAIFISFILGIVGGVIAVMNPIGMAYVVIVFWMGVLLKNVLLPPPSRTIGYYGGY